MRVTGSLNPDVARIIQQRMHEREEGFDKALNDMMLRQGVSNQCTGPLATYQMRGFDSPFEPGINVDKINQMLDEHHGHRAGSSSLT